jgi:hypothetical protein
VVDDAVVKKITNISSNKEEEREGRTRRTTHSSHGFILVLESDPNVENIYYP